MPFVSANGITLAYEDYGSPKDPVVLLIMGVGAQLTLWPTELVEALVARGFRVIRFDNRDIGLSTKLDHFRVPPLPWIVLSVLLGRTPRVPYTLRDMAADTVGLLDSLGIERAHLVGASMGGMIAQMIAADWPDRVHSLTSIMSSTGNRALPTGRPEAWAVLTRRPRAGQEEKLVEHGVRARMTLAGSRFRPVEATLRKDVRESVRRGSHPPGVARQLAAALAAGDRRRRLASISAPTLVIHGADDPLVPLSSGEDTARCIPDAELKVIEGMGHEIPAALADVIADGIKGVAARAKAVPARKPAVRPRPGSRARTAPRPRSAPAL